MPELCKAYTPGKSDQDLPARVNRLEQIIEAALPHLAGINGSLSSVLEGLHQPSRSVSIGPDDDGQSQQDENDPGAGTFSNGKWYGDTVSSSVAPGSVLEQVSAHPCVGGLAAKVSWCSCNTLSLPLSLCLMAKIASHNQPCLWRMVMTVYFAISPQPPSIL